MGENVFIHNSSLDVAEICRLNWRTPCCWSGSRWACISQCRGLLPCYKIWLIWFKGTLFDPCISRWACILFWYLQQVCLIVLSGQLRIIILFLYRESHVLFKDDKFLNGILDDIRAKFCNLLVYFDLSRHFFSVLILIGLFWLEEVSVVPCRIDFVVVCMIMYKTSHNCCIVRLLLYSDALQGNPEILIIEKTKCWYYIQFHN